jgi:hypothetical protein
MARSLARRRPHDLIEQLLETEDLARVVRGLDPPVLLQLVRQCGLEDAGPIVALATTEQLVRVFDEDLWRSDAAGSPEELDAHRFGLWLEVLVDADEGAAARTLAGMELELVAAAINLHMLVLDAGWAMVARSAAEALEEEADPLLEKWLLQAERVLETGQSVQLGEFRVVARSDRFWDALLSVLTTLQAEHPAFFGRLMERCSAASSEEVDDPRGLDEVLTAGEQARSDASGDREQRRERQGYVATSEAAAFLQLARRPLVRDPALDPLTTRYFRTLGSRAASPRPTPASSEPASRRFVAMLQDGGVLGPPEPPLLGIGAGEASDAPDRLSRLRAQLLHVRDHDAAAYARRTEELGYLGNVLVAGCSFQSRRFLPGEATHAALAVCSLGLEDGPHGAAGPPLGFLVNQDLVAVFRRGWSMLYERVCLGVPRRLVRVLGELKIHDAEIRRDLERLRTSLTAELEAGTPWRERERLEVLACLDPPAWATLLLLVGECPVVPKAASTRKGRAPLRVTTEFEFISENDQIVWALDYVDSLPERLAA